MTAAAAATVACPLSNYSLQLPGKFGCTSLFTSLLSGEAVNSTQKMAARTSLSSLFHPNNNRPRRRRHLSFSTEPRRTQNWRFSC